MAHFNYFFFLQNLKIFNSFNIHILSGCHLLKPVEYVIQLLYNHSQSSYTYIQKIIIKLELTELSG
jgi:hypothetical protein